MTFSVLIKLLYQVLQQVAVLEMLQIVQCRIEAHYLLLLQPNLDSTLNLNKGATNKKFRTLFNVKGTCFMPQSSLAYTT